ncbi:MAG: BREX-2 system adenine-specific DNA-methyltransferase PglX [Gammaproteobacteria bacterium]|nr:BREX-2 system adenine-specific DNA-methyltransferase PglX [Gammaproteobacteria bacterium]MBL4898885.1 BREX-2 system adenine-specific DNA-methyltransferase PglX [Colwellia sp.]
MINRSALLKDLQGELPKLEKDILGYSETREELSSHLQEEYDKAREAGRTSEHFIAWREVQITQAAVAWVLSCVFVRFLEDNSLLAEPLIAGPTKKVAGTVDSEQNDDRLDHAKQRMVAYYNEHPAHEEREYLFSVFEQLEKYPVIAELLDHRHNPLWQIPVSADGAKRLIDFFQKIDAESGEIVHDFTDADWDTRFLGDLYQDLSEAVRKRYALLQTPEFVESFILDYTLEKAKQTFGLPGLRLIDPTCGSGHFLLTTFERVFDDWVKREPATNSRVLAQRALDVVHGVDINPYAIAICRFRLLVAALKVSGTARVKDAPDFHFNLACGDSLLHGRRFEWQGQGLQTDLIDEDPIKHVLEVEDKEKLLKILGQQYHVVVGNPPYIVVKDKALNKIYRDKYLTCHRKYSLGVPFTERFFDLAIFSENGAAAGFIGMITTNSFIKREFGKKLIQDYLPQKDLTHIIDTSGASIPGHGTPTIILLARNRIPINDNVKAVLGIKGEPGTPSDPSKGLVWTSIKEMINHESAENDFIEVVSLPRAMLANHPWSIGGGGIGEVKDWIERDSDGLLADFVDVIGFGVILGEDDAFTVPLEKFGVVGFPEKSLPLVEGEYVRDWAVGCGTQVLFPYDENIELSVDLGVEKYLWPWRALLEKRKTFSKESYKEVGKSYAEFHQIPIERNKIGRSITFAFVATHNHFSFDRGGKVFNRSAPVIKLPNESSDSDFYSLISVLNCSLACFWMKQVMTGKHKGDGGEAHADPAFQRFEFAGTMLKKFPLRKFAGDCHIRYAKRIDEYAGEIKDDLKSFSFYKNKNVSESLSNLKDRYFHIKASMAFLQEELDWFFYSQYGVADESLVYQGEWAELVPGQRAFELDLAESSSGDSWFSRNGIQKYSCLPMEIPDDYKSIVELRRAEIASNKMVEILERPEYKRRWELMDWHSFEELACRDYIKNCICDLLASSTHLMSVAQISDRLHSISLIVDVAKVYSRNDTFDFQDIILSLISDEHVPQISSWRLKMGAIPKYRAWQDIWDKQRQEDRINVEFGLGGLAVDGLDDAKAVRQAIIKKAQVVGDIPIPPKYASTDFRKPNYWSLRGKLDVPKERFFSLPGCEKDGDATLVIGWAGMNHLQRAQAIASWYLDRKERDGWEADKLTPMLVAIDELIPWLKQWHNDIDPEFGERMGDYYEGFLLEELRQLNVSRDELLVWVPPAATKKKRATKKKKATAE